MKIVGKGDISEQLSKKEMRVINSIKGARVKKETDQTLYIILFFIVLCAFLLIAFGISYSLGNLMYHWAGEYRSHPSDWPGGE